MMSHNLWKFLWRNDSSSTSPSSPSPSLDSSNSSIDQVRSAKHLVWAVFSATRVGGGRGAGYGSGTLLSAKKRRITGWPDIQELKFFFLCNADLQRQEQTFKKNLQWGGSTLGSIWIRIQEESNKCGSRLAKNAEKKCCSKSSYLFFQSQNTID